MVTILVYNLPGKVVLTAIGESAMKTYHTGGADLHAPAGKTLAAERPAP